MLIESKGTFLKWKGVKSNLAGTENDQTAISDIFYPLDISFFTDKVRAGKNLLTIAEIWPTAFCDSHCNFCSSDIYNIKSKSRLTAVKLKEIINSLAEMGVNLIRFSGGGEPFLIENFNEIIEFTAEKKLQSLYITNGIHLEAKNIKALVKHANLVRFSLNAGTREDYLKVSGVDCFDKVVANVKLIAEERKRQHKEQEMYLGVNFIVTPDNYRGMSKIAEIAKSFGFDFILFRKCNPHKQRFFDQTLEILKGEVEKCLALSDKNFSVRCLLENVAGMRPPKKTYVRCSATNFRIFIDANGDVYPCFSAA